MRYPSPNGGEGGDRVGVFEDSLITSKVFVLSSLEEVFEKSLISSKVSLLVDVNKICDHFLFLF